MHLSLLLAWHHTRHHQPCTICRYLASNAHMQQVANTLLELMSLPPHPSLHAGKTTISISSECDHDRISGLEGLASSSMDNHFKTQVSQGVSQQVSQQVRLASMTVWCPCS